MVDSMVNKSRSSAVEIPWSPSEVSISAPWSGSAKRCPRFLSGRVLAVAIIHDRHRKGHQRPRLGPLSRTHPVHLLHIRTLSPNGWRGLQRRLLRGSSGIYFSETGRIVRESNPELTVGSYKRVIDHPKHIRICKTTKIFGAPKDTGMEPITFKSNYLVP